MGFNLLSASLRVLSKIIFFGFLLLFPLMSFASPGLVSIQFSRQGDTTRMTTTLTQPTACHVFTLSHPQRIVLDFDRTHLKAKNLKSMLQRARVLAPAITNIRVGYPRNKVLRIVLDLDRSVRYRFIMPAQSREAVLELMSTSKIVQTPAQTTTTKHTIVVVIDPGHGGKDPGAIGLYGTREKNVVLAISKALANVINQTPNMRAVLTRQGDYFVPLRGRLRLARRGKADLFVAVHADSWLNRRATGASVYALSQHGATSEAARWLAGRENISELAGVNLRELDDQSYLLRSVLIDLEQTATIRDSLHLGRSLLAELDEVTDLRYRHVEQAPFMVLKSPDIPSVLIETGFLSNRAEELRLRDPAYQGKIARAIFAGLQRYIKQYPSV
ncbi:MAG: N-acetylmuramoyl-L-alanine amidase [Gammaproteobacteria bacterium]|nr:N-acetylmuramoyl-L-alanine amidase [Gammaproteobacteria bacterium]